MPRPSLPCLVFVVFCLASLPQAQAQAWNTNSKLTVAGADKAIDKSALPVVSKSSPRAKSLLQGKSGLAVSRLQTNPLPPPPLDLKYQPTHWSGGGELGFASARGNSTTESLNGKLDANYSRGLWKHSASLTALRASAEYTQYDDDGNESRGRRTTANRYTAGANSAYSMDARGTLNASLRLEEDDFGTYSHQRSLSLSYGNRVIDNGRVQFDLQFGPGYRSAYDTNENREESGPIGRGLMDMRFAVSGNTELVNKLLVESGSYNTFAQNDLGLSVTMNSHLALKAGWQARHNSDVAPARKKTDTLTTMNVVYRFK